MNRSTDFNFISFNIYIYTFLDYLFSNKLKEKKNFSLHK